MRIFVITFSYLPMEQNRFESKFQYRVRHLPGYLGWVDLDLVSSPGWWAATAATYCPSRMVEHSKSKSTQPTDKPPAPPCSVQPDGPPCSHD